MKIRTMLGLAAVGGILYAHRKHGGEWTIDSFKDSARDLFDAIQANAQRAKEQAMETVREGARQVEQATQSTGQPIGANGRR
jgi:hypothetical protein